MHPEHDAARTGRSTEVPPEARELAETLSRDYEQRQSKAADALDRAIAAAAERARAEIHDLVSPELRRAVRDLKRRERLVFQQRIQPPLDGRVTFDEANRLRKASVDEVLMGGGSSPQKIKAVARQYLRNIADLLDSRRHAKAKAIAVRFHKGILDEWRKGPIVADPHRWFEFTPPFADGQEGFGVSRSPDAYRVAVNRHPAIDLSAGLVGHDVFIDIIDASDVDTAHGTADTQVAFWFQAPTAGLIEVLIEAQSGLALHHLGISDEWGTSDSDTHQNNYLMMHVLHPNVTAPSLASMSFFSVATDGSNTYDREFLTRGADFAAQLFSDGPVAADQWVMIRAGTGDDWTMTNDMEIHSASSFRWFLKRISVRVAP